MSDSRVLVIRLSNHSVVIGKLLRSTALYNGVKQRRPRLVLERMTVSICQFLLIVLRMRLLTKILWRCSCGDSMNFHLGLILCNFPFFFFFNFAYLKGTCVIYMYIGSTAASWQDLELALAHPTINIDGRPCK